jgi:hypothetical protein
LNAYSGPRWDVSRRALNIMEDILSTSYKWTLSAITHKLNVSGHMLIWTFFSCFGMWNSCPRFVRTFQSHIISWHTSPYTHRSIHQYVHPSIHPPTHPPTHSPSYLSSHSSFGQLYSSHSLSVTENLAATMWEIVFNTNTR